MIASRSRPSRVRASICTFSAALCAAAAAALLCAPRPAAAFNDPAGDFLATYAGPKNGDLDVLRANVFFDGTDFLFTSTQGGVVGSTAGAFYVWGIDRGAGTARFGALAPGVLFDSVVVIRPGGVSNVNTLTPSVTSLVLPDTNITISGNDLSARVPAALLPTQGFAPGQYTVNLWPRFGSATVTGNAQISDFAPNNSNAPVTVVPEPGSLAFLAGPALLCLLGGVRRRHSRRA